MQKVIGQGYNFITRSTYFYLLLCAVRAYNSRTKGTVCAILLKTLRKKSANETRAR